MATQVKRVPIPAKRSEQLKPVPRMVPATADRQQPSPDEIRMAAYHRWESAGKPPGDGVHFWLEAERALLDRQ